MLLSSQVDTCFLLSDTDTIRMTYLSPPLGLDEIGRDVEAGMARLRKIDMVITNASRLVEAAEMKDEEGIWGGLAMMEMLQVGKCSCTNCFPGLIRARIADTIHALEDQESAMQIAPVLMKRMREGGN